MKKYFLAIIICLIPLNVEAIIDRCENFKTDVRIQHYKYFGVGFPYWYGIAQLKQESTCRENLTAFDGGQGIAQFMPKTEQWVESLMRQNINPYNHDDAIKAQAFYMSLLQKENPCPNKSLWLTYQAYNGGWTLLKREAERAGKYDWLAMKRKCQRKTIILKNGKSLNFCDVNYDYSKRIYNYGQKYKISESGRFW